MRILLAVILLLAAAWSGYWLFGARATENGLRAWFEQRGNEAWVADYAELNTQGFPNRFDTTVTDLHLADPATGLAWSAPFFQIFQLSYRPQHIIAIWPDRQMVATPNQNIALSSDQFRGSLKFRPGIDLALSEGTIEMEGLALQSSADWTGALERGQLSLRQSPDGGENRYDLYFAARNMTLPDGLRQLAEASEHVSETVQTLAVTASLEFTAPWDRKAIEVARPQITAIDLELAQGTWGQLDLRAAGALQLDARGIPQGEITVKATNWREMLALARQADLLSPNLAALLENGLDMVARLSGNPQSIDVPLIFDRGRVSLGGLLPLGPAPQIYLR
ncbi:MAG: DUF2125 domain-containing protein [Mangrovicoccus sp.]|nr:DUF2125 domain-containing protein [Mangrovicoccus sp.]